MSESVEILESLQVERNKKIGSTNVRGTSDWSSYVDKVIAKKVEEKSEKIITAIAKYQKENPDYR